MVFPGSGFPVLAKVKAVLPCTAAGQEYLVVETSVSMIPAALLPSYGVWASPVDTLAGVLPPCGRIPDLTHEGAVGSSSLEPLSSAGCSFSSRCYSRCCNTRAGQMLMKDSALAGRCKCSAALFSLALASSFIPAQPSGTYVPVFYMG